MQLTSAWIGYDISYDAIEAHPQVKTWRAEGLQKRVALPEHHLTIEYFSTVDSDTLARALSSLSSPLEQTRLTLNGYGTLGEYTYLSPKTEPEREAWIIRQTLTDAGLIAPTEEKDFHISIGGADPFINQKPAQHPLSPELTLTGRLVLVGKSGQKTERFIWSDEQKAFLPADAKKRLPIHAIAIFPKIQADTAVATYLLAKYGESAFPGISDAGILFWTTPPADETDASLLQKGVLTVDLGGSLFDHHLFNQASGKREHCASTLIAEYLGIGNNPELKKVLAWAKRDDLEGKGTISDDSLDRAFGLSGLMMNLNRAFPDDPKRTLDYIMPLIHFHILEEKRRTEELPKEWEELLATGRAQTFTLEQGPAKDLKTAFVETDNIALSGFLRAAKRFDIIIQRRSSGHTNIMTQQRRSIDLRPVIAALRQAETRVHGRSISLSPIEWQQPGRVEGLDEWFYDDAANTLQNGGANPGTTPATRLRKEDIVEIVKRAIPLGRIGALKRKKEQGG